MAARNSKRTARVSKRRVENLHLDLCDISSLLKLALEHCGARDFIDYDDALAVRTLLVEGKARLDAHIEPLQDLASTQ